MMAQDLQKKRMEDDEKMTPVVRPILSVYDEDGMVFVAAEIPPLGLADRPCFKSARGRLKGSYVRVGDADKPMTEYEIYSYEAYRKKARDDIRTIENASLTTLEPTQLEHYLLKRKLDRPNLTALTQNQLYELTGIMRNGQLTLASILLFGLYPQALFPQLNIIAARIPRTEMGLADRDGQRFTDSKRLQGSLPEMLEAAIDFLNRNMRTAIRIDPQTGKRADIPEYPIDAVREAVLNALVHRDYSIHTENMPIQLIMFSDRIEIRNPGGLYGRMTVDQLGKMPPDTRNPFLVTAMEALGYTENRYSGIPKIRQAMDEANLPAPVFCDSRGEFSVCLYSRQSMQEAETEYLTPPDDTKGLLDFCKAPRTRKEIADFLHIASQQYAIRRYMDPLVQSGAIQLANPEHPRSPKQTYQTNPGF